MLATLKFTWKLLLRSFAIFCIFIIVYLLMGEWLGKQVVNNDFVPDPDGVTIYIISNGVHTDIAVPTVSEQIDWTEWFEPETFKPIPESAKPEYLAFGWGDRGLYEEVPTWGDLTASILVRSMLLPSQSAMHLTYYDYGLKRTENSIPVNISQDQYAILIEEFLNSFDTTADGTPKSLECCFYPRLNDQFYASPTNYHIMYTCNMWTNTLLKKAGIPTAKWAPTQDNIMIHLKNRDLTK